HRVFPAAVRQRPPVRSVHIHDVDLRERLERIVVERRHRLLLLKAVWDRVEFYPTRPVRQFWRNGQVSRARWAAASRRHRVACSGSWSWVNKNKDAHSSSRIDFGSSGVRPYSSSSFFSFPTFLACFSFSFSARSAFFTSSSLPSSSMMAKSAPSPFRFPSLMMRLYPPFRSAKRGAMVSKTFLATASRRRNA